MRGIERLVAEGGDPSKVASVASFFVSRIDTEADRRLDAGRRPRGAQGQARDRQREARLPALPGGLRGPRWEYLAGKGATPQRVLWASTSTKNPDYPDTVYVEE